MALPPIARDKNPSARGLEGSNLTNGTDFSTGRFSLVGARSFGRKPFGRLVFNRHAQSKKGTCWQGHSCVWQTFGRPNVSRPNVSWPNGIRLKDGAPFCGVIWTFCVFFFLSFNPIYLTVKNSLILQSVATGNANWWGWFSTVDLLIKAACFVKK
jgi:hypothetical protein